MKVTMGRIVICRWPAGGHGPGIVMQAHQNFGDDTMDTMDGPVRADVMAFSTHVGMMPLREIPVFDTEALAGGEVYCAWWPDRR